MSKQPRDDANEPIPVLGLRPAGGSKITFNASTATVSGRFANSIRVITLYSTADCYIEIGDDTVIANSANSHFVPLGFIYDVALGSQLIASETSKFISAIGDSASGTLYISERN